MDRRAPVLVIDLLRFAAAAAVVAYHLGASATLHATAPIHLFGRSMPDVAVTWTWAGWIGVELFFVISGYVIARSASGAAPGAFLRRRALRLAPAAWLCASATALVLLAGSRLTASDIAARWAKALLFLPTTAPIDGSYWSLEVEGVFYLLVALGLRGGDDAAERLAVRVGVASAVFLVIASRSATMIETLGGSPWLPLTLMPHGVFFALGAVLAGAAGRGWTRAGAGLALLFGGAGAIEIALHAHAVAHDVPGIGGAATPLLLFAAGVLAIAAAARWQAPLARTVGAARLTALGLVTYPLYLLHQVIGAGLVALGMRLGVPAGWAAVGAVAMVLALAFAVSGRAEPWLRARLAGFSRSRGLVPDIPPSASLPAG